MGEVFEKLFTAIGAAALRRFGWWSLVIAALLLVGTRLLFILLASVQTRYAQLAVWVFPGANRKRYAKLTAGFAIVVIAASFFLFPSTPVTLFGFAFGIAALAVKFFNNGTSSVRLHYAVVLVTLFCFGLTLGGILHDVAFPPMALCRDGSYSDSSLRRGTCSWHGGVRQWGPDPWWISLFE